MEYEEILQQKYAEETVENFLEAINVAVNTVKVNPYFNWKLLSDADDNKFSDCAIAAGVDYLVTEDRDFDLLKTIEFPRVTVISLQQFSIILGA